MAFFPLPVTGFALRPRNEPLLQSQCQYSVVIWKQSDRKMGDPGQSPRRIFVFSHPRTASNLFMRMLENHPQLEIFPYAFQKAWHYDPESLRRQAHDEDAMPEDWKQDSLDETYQKAFDRVQNSMLKAEQNGKISIFKEHVCLILDPEVAVANISAEARAKRVVVQRSTIINHDPSAPLPGGCMVDSPSNGGKPSPVPANPTVLPTSFLRTMSPVCLFRHPAPMFESYYRVAVRAGGRNSIHDEDFPLVTSLRWVRLLHDWYSSTGDVPITIEADDLINEDSVMPKFCKALGLDPRYLQMQWDKVPEETKARQGSKVTSFKQTIQNSTGIIRSKRRETEIKNDQERERWANEFGEEVAAALYRAVEDAMPDYVYLRSKRLV